MHCIFHCHTLGVYLKQAYYKRKQRQLEDEIKKAEEEKAKLKQQVDKEVELRLQKEKGRGSKFNPDISLENMSWKGGWPGQENKWEKLIVCNHYDQIQMLGLILPIKGHINKVKKYPV